LFSNVSGRVTVDVDVAGNVVTGDDFSARLSVEVIGGGGLAAAVYPNPLNPVGTLTFVKTRSGYATVAVYDLRGRLVRTLLDDRSARAGYRDVAIDGRDESGAVLPSGIYFYRVETDEGAATGRFAVVK
jgi:flagellar hook assembly protein FlgD